MGEDVTNELVDWLNAVDATYRADLREFNELNFQRFDMKQEQRLSALREELTITWERRFASLRKDLAEQIAGLRTELTREIAGLRTELTTELTRGVEGLRTDLAKQRAEIIKWMFVFWAGTVFSVAGLMLAFLRVA